MTLRSSSRIEVPDGEKQTDDWFDIDRVDGESDQSLYEDLLILRMTNQWKEVKSNLLRADSETVHAVHLQ